MTSKLSSDYPITTAYGWVTGYPLNLDPANHPGQGFHKGEDYAMDTGTPIVVNNVLIGFSGATGQVTGPHVHVGRWINGGATPPNGKAWALDNPRVTDVGFDSDNGNYVGLVDAAGVRWVYLHMREKSTSVQPGDVLANLPKFIQGGTDMSKIDLKLALEQADAQWGWSQRSKDRDAILARDIVGRETNEAVDFMYNHEWGVSWRNYRNSLIANQPTDLQAKIDSIRKIVN